MKEKVFIKVVGKNNKEYLVSPDQIKVGDKTLKEILQDLNKCQEDIKILKNYNEEKDKTLRDLSDKIAQLVSFSMES